MAKCDYCGQEMTKHVGCKYKKFILDTGERFERLKVGEEGWYHRGDTCGDCGAPYGTYHHFGCDEEPCPICGDQAAFCECHIEKMSI